MSRVARTLTFALVFALVAPGSARAQTSDDALAEVEAQRDLATGLYVTAGVLVGAGLVALVAGGVASLGCGPGADCSAAEIAIGVGAAGAGAGLVTFIVATFVADDASDRRRRILRERLALSVVPELAGAGLSLRLRF